MDPSLYPSPASPPPPPPPTWAPAPPGTPAAAPGRNKKIIIIAVVVGALLLCCCGVGVAGVLYWNRTKTDGQTNGNGSTGTTTGTGEPVDPAWTAFKPTAYDPAVYGAPTARLAGLAEEINATHYPSFQIAQTLLEPGYLEEDTYWDDILYVNASLDGSPEVRIAVRYSVEQDEAKAADLSYNPDDLSEGKEIGTTADDTEYIWDSGSLAPLQVANIDSSTTSLLKQIAADFPGCVIFYVAIDQDTAYASITRWEAYPTLEGGFDVDYTRDGSAWTFSTAQEF